jgi:hypothetical protein
MGELTLVLHLLFFFQLLLVLQAALVLELLVFEVVLAVARNKQVRTEE